MKRLTAQQQQQVADAITAVEKKTDAELVTVLARRADRYVEYPLLWAALLSLLVPLVGVLLPRLGWLDVFVWQWLLFIVLTLLFGLPWARIHLVPRHVRHQRAALLARSQFLMQNLHATRENTGLLIFVSEAERYVEILADSGISRHVHDTEWQALIDSFTRQVRRGETLAGFLDCIEGVGIKLAQHVPATRVKDELPNHLVLLDG